MAQPDDFDVAIAGALEAERRLLAQPFINQFMLGIITVEELASKLEDVVRNVTY